MIIQIQNFLQTITLVLRLTQKMLLFLMKRVNKPKEMLLDFLCFPGKFHSVNRNGSYKNKMKSVNSCLSQEGINSIIFYLTAVQIWKWMIAFKIWAKCMSKYLAMLM